MKNPRIKNIKSGCVHGKNPNYKVLSITFCGLDSGALYEAEESERPVSCKTCVKIMKSRGIEVK